MGFFTSLATIVLNSSRESRNRFKGAIGEAQAALGMSLRLPWEYKVIDDVLLPSQNGTSQIDHVVVSNYGIFVIESKNISGSIFGSVGDKHWTVRRGTAKFSFYNPLRQNAGHIKALAATTKLPERYFHSLVFFWAEDCQFKTAMPENVIQKGLISYIVEKRRYLLSNQDVRTAIRMIEAVRLKPTKANAEAHVANLKQRLHLV